MCRSSKCYCHFAWSVFRQTQSNHTESVAVESHATHLNWTNNQMCGSRGEPYRMLLNRMLTALVEANKNSFVDSSKKKECNVLFSNISNIILMSTITWYGSAHQPTMQLDYVCSGRLQSVDRIDWRNGKLVHWFPEIFCTFISGRDIRTSSTPIEAHTSVW